MDLKDQFPLVLDSNYVGTRLDTFLSSTFSAISRSRWSRIIKDGHLSVNGKQVLPSYILKSDDVLDVNHDHLLSSSYEVKEEILQEQQVFEGPEPLVLYEDEDVLVINKPKGLAVHKGAGILFKNTLVAWLLTTRRIPKDQHSLVSFGETSLEEGRPGIVHRLDKPTSGALLICKNPSYVEKLGNQFASKTAKRKYWAWVSPKYDPKLEQAQLKVHQFSANGTKILLKSEDGVWFDFVSYMGRDPNHRIRFSVQAEGKRAHSRFKLVETVKNQSKIEIDLMTGRTHQIRVHLSFLGYPIIGDEVYGGYGSSALRLHAFELSFVHPKTEKPMTIKAPLTEEDLNWSKQEGFSV